MNFQLLLILGLFSVHCNSQSCDLLGAHEDEISRPCMNQLNIVCSNGSVLWRMIDASSKYPLTGMSYSDNKDLGNFDECISLHYKTVQGEVNGKYCGLSVLIANPLLRPIPDPFETGVALKSLAQTNSTQVRATPSIAYSVLSLCVPDQCTPEEVGNYFIGSLIDEVKVIGFRDAPCVTKDSNTTFYRGDIVFTIFLSLIGFLLVASTTYDFVMQKIEREIHNPLFLAFSVLTNGKKLLHISESRSGQIECLNGMRFISMMWVIAGHNYVAMERFALVNYAEVDEFIGSPKSQYIGAAPLAVDTFFFLSGFLLTFGYLKASGKKSVSQQIGQVPVMYVHRYLRLTPALAVLYLAIISIFRMLGTGPLWDAMVQLVTKQCKDHWWPFFLYVQNYVNYNDMCLWHTWYLSADMQLFLLAPLVLIPLTILVRNDKMSVVYYGLGVLTFLAVIFPMLARFLDQTIDNDYDSHSRINDYLIGVGMGVIMSDHKFSKFPFSKLANLAIWCSVLVVCTLFILYYHNVINIYEHTKDTLFYGLYRPVWCTSLAWMVYSCFHGRGGPINWLLSLPVFQVGARLSYCMYLLHAVVQMYFVGIIRTQYFWGHYMGFYLWCGHFFVTVLMAAVWTLAFESPMIVIERYLFRGGRKQAPRTK